MRIDSSGNLLVGKTGTSFGTDGVEIKNDQIWSTNTSSDCISLNRKTDDGAIATFYKDGTTVGSIFVSGDDMGLGTGNVGIRFLDSGQDRIIPRTTSNGAANGTIDLGDSGSRFKDLYLSGGAYLGGTGAANKLDDYEEGSWTPTSTATAFQQAYGTYTKVGNIVNAWFAVQVASSINANFFQLNGLPFSYSNTTGGMSGGSMGLTDMNTNEFTFYVTGSTILLLNLTNNGYLRYNTYADKFLRGHVVYRTS